MDYLIEFLITIPDDAPEAEVRERLDGEGARVAELAAEGHALRVWKPLPDDGRRRALGLYRAASDAELQGILDSLPLRPWMDITVTALAEHPNDPARPPRPLRVTMAAALPAPRLRHVFRLDAELGAPVDVGDTPQGRRRIVALTGGRADGPELTAELVAGSAADWQLVRPSGSAVADLRYVLRTDRGAVLYVQAQGIRHGPPDVLARLAAGEDVDPATYTFRTTVTIETADEQLAWLNDGVFVAVGGRWPQGVSYDVYLVE